MSDNSSFTAFSGTTAWGVGQSYSNAADLSTVYPGVYTSHNLGINSIVEDYVSQKATTHQ